MIKKSKQLGFTLIELLVVIAIIGVLASIILAQLNTARTKGNDAKVKETLSNLRTQAALYYDDNSGYGATSSLCTAGMFADPKMAPFVAAGSYPSGTTLACFSTTGANGAYAVSASLSSGYWCVDSAGASKPTGPAITTVCP